MAPWVLLDDTAFIANSNILGNGWARSNAKNNQAFNSTLTSWSSGGGQSMIPPELNLTYSGADINFYGTINAGVAANYTLDGSTQMAVPFPIGVASGKTGINLFSLPNLTEDTNHTVNFFPLSGLFTLDYVTYIPNNLTPLTGTNLLLDDGAPELQYSGLWNHTTGDFRQGRPHNWTMSGTNALGSTMQVAFEGSSISVYGLLNNVDGRLSCSFILDNDISSATKFTPFDDEQEDTDPSSWMLSRQFFQQDLPPGQHSLLINLTDVSSQQMLWLDYIVYEGASSTRLTTPPGTTPGATPGSTPGGTTIPGGEKKSSLPTGAIVGIVIVVSIFAMVLLYYAKKKFQTSGMRHTTGLSNKPFDDSVYEQPLPPIPGPQTPVMHGPPTINPYNNQYEPVPLGYNVPLSPPPPHTQPPYQHAPPSFQRQMQQPVQHWDTPDSAYTSTTSTTALTAENYYAYNEKGNAVKLELQWNTRSATTNGSSSTSDTTRSRSSARSSSVPMQSIGAFPGDPHSLPLDSSKESTVTPKETHADRILTTWNRTPSNHAHEDGRDDDSAAVEEPHREKDAGPVMSPPAYDDRLYS